MRKLLIALGVGSVACVAFVLGAKTGRGRYQEIVAAASALWNDPKVKKARKRATKEAEKAAKFVAKKTRKLGN
ncbi:MAG TPA: hypothetical protein VIJ18_04885 [Microbacteriaceae bacterium]